MMAFQFETKRIQLNKNIEKLELQRDFNRGDLFNLRCSIMTSLLNWTSETRFAYDLRECPQESLMTIKDNI